MNEQQEKKMRDAIERTLRAAFSPKPDVEVVARAIKQKWDETFEGYLNGEPIYFTMKPEAATRLAQAAISAIFKEQICQQERQ